MMRGNRVSGARQTTATQSLRRVKIIDLTLCGNIFRRMKDQKKPETTLDTLARLVAGGFAHVNERFDGVEGRLEKIDTRLEAVAAAVESVDRRLHRIEDILLEDHGVRLKRLEAEVFGARK